MNKPVYLGVIVGLTSVAVAGHALGRREARKIEEQKKVYTKIRLAADLVEWLNEARSNGYTADQIREHAQYDMKFIDIVTNM